MKTIILILLFLASCNDYRIVEYYAPCDPSKVIKQRCSPKGIVYIESALFYRETDKKCDPRRK